MVQGGLQFYGWTTDREISAGIYNLLRAIAAGLGGQKVRVEDLITRPQPVVEKATSIADFDISGFMRLINS